MFEHIPAGCEYDIGSQLLPDLVSKDLPFFATTLPFQWLDIGSLDCRMTPFSGSRPHPWANNPLDCPPSALSTFIAYCKGPTGAVAGNCFANCEHPRTSEFTALIIFYILLFLRTI